MSSSTTTSTSSKTFSIQGKNLKANSAQDLEPYLTELKGLEDVEEVIFGGNSLGVEACQAIAEVLKSKSKLKVGLCRGLGVPLSRDLRIKSWSDCGYHNEMQ